MRKMLLLITLFSMTAIYAQDAIAQAITKLGYPATITDAKQ